MVQKLEIHKKHNIEQTCKIAKTASLILQQASTEEKNNALSLIKASLINHQEAILEANKQDLALGKKLGLNKALLDRLALNSSRLQGIYNMIDNLIEAQDPIDSLVSGWRMPNGLHIKQYRVPLGVIGIIYEARPNVTVDTSALCLKSGNCIVLRGSSSAYQSNLALVTAIKEGLKKSTIPSDCVGLIHETSRETLSSFLTQRNFLDLLIPRGGKSLIDRVVKESTIPTLETGVGNCHIFVDASYDISKAIKIIVNAKTQRPSVCNACETLLIHQSIAKELLTDLVKTLKQKNVFLVGCQQTCNHDSSIQLAVDDDWEQEFLDLKLAIKIVSSTEEAIRHISQYGSKHSEAILSHQHQNIRNFSKKVDAAAILINASTRFTDGEQIGFGAEMGISTQKLHTRGPVGLLALCSTKFIIEGDGHTRK